MSLLDLNVQIGEVVGMTEYEARLPCDVGGNCGSSMTVTLQCLGIGGIRLSPKAWFLFHGMWTPTPAGKAVFEVTFDEGIQLHGALLFEGARPVSVIGHGEVIC
jgi:hypothetical protein